MPPQIRKGLGRQTQSPIIVCNPFAIGSNILHLPSPPIQPPHPTQHETYPCSTPEDVQAAHVNTHGVMINQDARASMKVIQKGADESRFHAHQCQERKPWLAGCFCCRRVEGIIRVALALQSPASSYWRRGPWRWRSRSSP